VDERRVERAFQLGLAARREHLAEVDPHEVPTADERVGMIELFQTTFCRQVRRKPMSGAESSTRSQPLPPARGRRVR
jgi:hypothetical protein